MEEIIIIEYHNQVNKKKLKQLHAFKLEHDH